MSIGAGTATLASSCLAPPVNCWNRSTQVSISQITARRSPLNNQCSTASGSISPGDSIAVLSSARALIEAIANSRSAKICDLGCGNGTLLAKLRTHGFQVVGIEPSPFARREVESKGIRVYEGTAESLPTFHPGIAIRPRGHDPCT